MELDLNNNQQPTRKNIPLFVGFLLTAVWVLFFTYYWIRNFETLVTLEANNLGDFLAGTFAPLAFLWLVVATLLQRQELELQREELRQSRNALELQANELKNSVEQFSQQTKIMNDELRLSTYQVKWQEIDASFEDVCRKIPAFLEQCTFYGEQVDPYGDVEILFSILSPRTARRYVDERDFDKLIEEIDKRLFERRELIYEFVSGIPQHNKDAIYEALSELMPQIMSIINLVVQNEHARLKNRLKSIGFYRLHENLSLLQIQTSG